MVLLLGGQWSPLMNIVTSGALLDLTLDSFCFYCIDIDSRVRVSENYSHDALLAAGKAYSLHIIHLLTYIQY